MENNIAVENIYELQKVYFNSQATKSVAFRLDSLHRLKEAIKDHQEQISLALREDLNKSAFDTFSTEIGIVLEEISFVSKRLKKWAKVRSVTTAITHFGTKGLRYPEPYGSVLIIAPWNYPFQLAISPLIGAIAAGNCAVIKPSELTPKTSALIAQLIEGIFEPSYIAVVEGAVEASQALLDLPFDYIFFTGSVAVGKIVMEAASKHLTPITLELGGKSPCIVHHDANLKLAAKRIAWGKFLNAGQTCIAPDYLYVHEQVYDAFIVHLKAAIHELYMDNALKNPDYVRIVSERHFNRLVGFLDEGKIIEGGNYDVQKLCIQPTLIADVDWNAKIMEDEIFGPLLPILKYNTIEEVVQVVQGRPHPLALYLFSEDKNIINKVIAEIEFGGGCINDVIYHIATAYLPFGGKGSSGMGAYHGKASFDTFTHYKSVLKQTNLFDIPFRYPNNKYGLKILKMLFK